MKLPKKVWFGIPAVLCVTACIVMELISQNLAGNMISQQAGERWQNENLKSSQISVFFTPSSENPVDAVTGWHESIDTALTSASLKKEKDKRLWCDAYSTQTGQMEITGTRKMPAKALVTVVGGDFFLIHAPKLVSGGYFSEQDLMHDRVVIDSLLAWQLFGSENVAGMQITVQGQSCLVAGVVRPEQDTASQISYGEKPRIYMAYDFYQKNWQKDQINIQCYEAVLPNQVKGFAQKTVSEALELTNTNDVILQNTDRYSLQNRWDTLKHLKKMLVCEAVTYPYWENAARIVSYDTALLLRLEMLCAVYPLLYVLYLISRAYLFCEKWLYHKKSAWKNRYRSQLKQSS